jgi:TRAP transporter TAXI family solute receptor
MKRTMGIFVWAVMAFAFLASSEAMAQSEVKFIKIATASQGGLWYLAGGALAAEIKKAIPGIETSSTTGGSVANATSVNKGTEIQLGFNNAAIQSLAFEGKPPFKAPHPDLRMIGTLDPMFWHMLVPRSSSIRTIYDLKDKRINLGRVGSLDRHIAVTVLRHYGITADSIKANGGAVHALSFNDSVDMARDGHLDGVFGVGGIMPFLIDMDTNPGARWLPISGKERDAILSDPEMKGFGPGVLKKGMFDGITEDLPTIQVKSTITVNKNLPDDLVYRLTKVIFESGFQKDVFAAGEAKGLPKSCNPADVKGAASIPLHPGAVKYFKEKGIPF